VKLIMLQVGCADESRRCNGDHSLSACRKRPDPSNPTPYATCFVCLSQGHLSSQCPQNERGVYVNGGACKICGSVKHRAKDCPKIRVREEDVVDELGGGRQGYREAGADEDDWMVRPREDGGKKRKHAPANNGLREKHRKEGVVSATASGEPSSAIGAKGPAKPKKVVAF
jgi:zinc finger CCHC domain-containing protein 9